MAKTMRMRLLTIAFGIAFASTLLISFDHHNKNIIDQVHKNRTKVLDNDSYKMISIPGGAVGPESFTFDGNGDGPYTGVSDGRIIRWVSNESRWVDFAVTSPTRDGCEGHSDHSKMEKICGRPLGLHYNKKTKDLYIADAYMGLLVVGPNGGLASPITNHVEGVPFGFTNSLDIDETNGIIYFTDSSTTFQRRNHISVIISGDNSGRLLKFELKTNKTTLLLDNLKFPNGVALSQDGNFLLFTETTTCRILKYWLKTSNAGKIEVVAELPGFPDNIKRNRNGEFWVGINSRRGKLVEWIIANSWIGKSLIRISPIDVTEIYLGLAKRIGKTGLGIRLNRDGNVVEVLDNKRWNFVSEVDEDHNGNLWIGSVTNPFVVTENSLS